MVGPLIRSLRPTQWVKNLFVVAPLVFAQALDVAALAARSVLAFVAFCAIASTVYLINDLRDRERDRLHPRKRTRPIAAGQVSPRTATVTAAVLLVVALGLAVRLGTGFTATILVYFVLNLLYTFVLKQWVIVDVMTVSFFYVLRVIAGAQAIRVEVSTWLLLCTIFLALFLAFSKRRHEIMLLDAAAAQQRDVLSQYSVLFLDQMMNVVTASTLITYVLYTRDPATLEKFGTDQLIVTVPFVLFGIFRYLYLTYQVSDPRNPTESMLGDPPFLINLGLWVGTVLVVIYVG